jgi:hypothetical protein
VIPVVVVDVVPADVPAEQAQVLVDACTGAVPNGACALAGSLPESARPDAVALVLWQSTDFLLATVRVGRRNGEWVTRQLAFSSADPPHDRWVAAGLTVATLLDETQPVARASAPAPAPALPLASPSPVVPRPARAIRYGLGAGLLLGNGWDHGSPQWGASLSLSLRPTEGHWLALASASYAVSDGPRLSRAGEVHSRWLGLELGVGLQARLAQFRLFALPELAYQAVKADTEVGATLNDHALQLKLRVGSIWEASTHWGFSLAADTRILPFEGPASDTDHVRRSGFVSELVAGVELSP